MLIILGLSTSGFLSEESLSTGEIILIILLAFSLPLLVALRAFRATQAEQMLLVPERTFPPPPAPQRAFFWDHPLRPQEHPGLFKGREVLLKETLKILKEGESCLLLWGQARIGKSSLLYQLPQQLSGSERLELRRLHCHDSIQSPPRWLQQTLERGAAIPPPKGAGWEETLSWLERLDSLRGGVGERLLMVFENIERLRPSPELIEAFSSLRVLPNTWIALTSIQHPSLLKEPWERLLFTPLQLRSLSPKAAQALINQPNQDLSARYGSRVTQAIQLATQGQPALIQQLCALFIERLQHEEREQGDLDDFEWAVQRLLQESPLFEELWEQLSPPERALLQTLSQGSRSIPARAEGLQSLIRQDLLRAKGQTVMIHMPLLARWIREVGCLELKGEADDEGRVEDDPYPATNIVPP